MSNITVAWWDFFFSLSTG